MKRYKRENANAEGSRNRMNNLKNTLYFAAGLIILGFLLKIFSYSKCMTTEDMPFNQRFKVYSVPLPDTMSFGGEGVPMNHLGVREGLEQELLVNTYWQSQSVLMLKRSSRYLPVIEKILKKYSVPDDFKYLAMAESGFSYKISPAGAAGFWQLMKSTAMAYHLQVNKEVDERYNLEKSTEAACRYFNDAYQVFHNWTLVAASYNMGIGGLTKEIDREGESAYYNLSLNLETSRYIYRILALKLLTTHPEWYGYYLNKQDYYQPIPSYTVNVDSTIGSLADFCKAYGINFHTLKFFNPWLMAGRLSNPDQTEYTLTLPKTNVPFSELGEDIVYNDSTGNGMQAGAGGASLTAAIIDTARVPSCSTRKEPGGVTAPDTVQPKIIVHIVQPGETIECLADKFRVSVDEIRAWNSISDTLIVKPGDELMMFVR